MSTLMLDPNDSALNQLSTASSSSLTGHPVSRALMAASASLLMTFTLLFFMYALVKNDYELVEQPEEIPRIEDIHMKEPPPLENLPPKIERPIEPEPEPVMPQHEVVLTPSEPGLIIAERITPDTPDISVASVGGDQLMPFIKVQPNYPVTATQRGIEGFVDVVFDVTEIGATENIRIVHAEPSSIFNRSVIQAIQRWKYRPQLVDGIAVKSYDVRERITFQFD